MALPFAVLISGRGSNLLALERATRDDRIDGRITLVLSDRADAAGIPAASALGLATTVLEPRGMDRAAYGAALSAALEESGAELVALAGFMRILDGGFVRRWEGRLLNIHPSLLPAWRGLHTHRRVLEAGERAHGCTVHYVVEELDAGPIVIQGRSAPDVLHRVAREIKHLLDVEDVRAGDILVVAATQPVRVKRALERAGIPAVAYGGKSGADPSGMPTRDASHVRCTTIFTCKGHEAPVVFFVNVQDVDRAEGFIRDRSPDESPPARAILTPRHLRSSARLPRLKGCVWGAL